MYVEFEVNGFHIEIYPLMSVIQIKGICFKYLLYLSNFITVIKYLITQNSDNDS